ncbi:hypothetical protein J4734_11125 [Klebsiella pneumoniae]|uniref:Uncharacterized protein n=1 Tax=Klebsiella pneumoniae TaxID=573 RepID=A0A939NUG8_KLEPN|nr:hypothetical protein [Klebsiella pneumoniae]
MRRYFAGWRLRTRLQSLSQLTPRRPGSAAPPGDAIRHGAALLPGGGYALPGLPGLYCDLVGPVSAAPPGDSIRHGAAFMPGGGWRLPGLRGLSGLDD